jgi:general secretion pathway protein C
MRLVSLSLTALSAVILGASIVHWGMQMRTLMTNQVIQTQKSSNIMNAELNVPIFGRSTEKNNIVPDVALAPAPSNLKLIGVMTSPRPGMGVAIISVEGKSDPYREGQEIASGIQLQSVKRDSVVLLQNNQLLELALEKLNKNTSALPPQIANTGTTPLPNAKATKNPSFKLEVQNLGPNQFSFSQAELNKGLQDPKMRNSFGEAIPSPSGGLLLKEVPNGSLLDRLGLRTGDVLRQANGQQLNNLADIPALYQQFGNGGMVKLELLRGGQPSQIQYTVRP